MSKMQDDYQVTDEQIERFKRLGELRDDEIDFSDIPEITDDQIKALYPRNWKPVKKPISIRMDSDNLEWLKEKGPGYQKRLNAVIRWARMNNCPL